MSGSISIAGERERLEALSFREYRPADLQRCIDITAQAWPELTTGGLDLATMEWYGWLATWKEVACISDVPIGILFGKIDSDIGMLGRLRGQIAHAMVYLKILFGLYGKIPRRLAAVRGGLSSDRDFARNSPEADGEITYFVVDSAYRGMGIGKELIGRFIEHAKRKGARRISVYTTEPGSDWGFYENYGFKRYSLFRDSFMTVIRNEEVKAMIYVLDVG